MRLLFPILFSLLLGAVTHAAQVNIIETSVNDADGSTLDAVATSGYVEIGSTHTTVTAPITAGGFRFTHWTYSGDPGQTCRDPWGRALNPASLVVQTAATATAHYLPSTRDTDGDSVPDWYGIEYFGNLSHAASDDSDGDGISLIDEFAANTSPLHANSRQQGDVPWADSGMVTCNLAAYPTYTLRSVPAGTVNQSAPVAPDTVVTVPDLAGNADFSYWTLDGVRQQDAWGRAWSTFSFTMATANREAVAWLTTGDSDNDGVPDAYEQRYYGSLSNGASSDTDGDGITLLAEYSNGSSPVYADSRQEGDVTWVDSGMVTCNLAAYPTYTIRSLPPGIVNQSGVAAPGTVVTVPDLAGNANFAWWTLDGVRQQDAWGRALSSFSFTMAATNRTAEAHLINADNDGDGVPDAYEQRYYGTLSNGGSSDTDGDGFTLLAECSNVTSPLFGDSRQEGGNGWVDSALVTADLQGAIQVEQPLGFILTDGGSSDFGALPAGSRQSLSFVIRNVGGTPLTGLEITKDGPAAAEFRVTSSPVAPVAHNGMTSLTLEFVSGIPGWRSATLHLASNDANENPFDLILTGYVETGWTAYQLWARSAGLYGAAADSLAIPFDDGVCNLLKYAFNMDGFTADCRVLTVGTGTSGLPCPGGGAGVFRLEFPRRIGAGLIYTPMTSTSLLPGSWQPMTATPEIFPINAGWERVVYQQSLGSPLALRLFGRVAVVLP